MASKMAMRPTLIVVGLARSVSMERRAKPQEIAYQASVPAPDVFLQVSMRLIHNKALTLPSTTLPPHPTPGAAASSDCGSCRKKHHSLLQAQLDLL